MRVPPQGGYRDRVILDGKRCLVIGGGGTGIGRTITRAFGDAGARVAVADVAERRAREAAAELGERGLPLTVDVRSPSDLAFMVEQSMDRLGGLDVVVTVVGGRSPSSPPSRCTRSRTTTGTPSTSSTSGTSRAPCGWSCPGCWRRARVLP